MGATVRQEALERLRVLVGEWVVEAEFPGQAVGVGRSVFEWALDGQFLVQRTEVPDPAPDSTAIVSVEPERGVHAALLRRAGGRTAVRDDLRRRGVAAAA